MSPQIHEEEEYLGAENDIFSCGVILFILKAKNPPFRIADKTQDNWYKVFNGNKRIFWEKHNAKKNI